VKIRSTAMADLLTLGDTGFVGGYVASEWARSRQGRNAIRVSAVRVDYDFEVASSRAGLAHTLVVHVEGTGEADARAKKDALLAIVEAGPWVLDVYEDSTTEVWLCDPVEVEPFEYLDGIHWRLSLTIPARPAF
jgi:hypothetical protein